MADRADMILMRVGDENAVQPIAALRQPGDVGQDKVHPRRAVHVGKAHADIDQDKPLLAFGAKAVDIAIHPDLPRAAEGEVDQPFGFAHIAPCSLLYL